MRVLLSLMLLVSGLTLLSGAEKPGPAPAPAKPAPAPAKKEGPWRVSVRRRGDKSVFMIGETASFIFTLTGPDGKRAANRQMKIELWLDGKHHVRYGKTDATGRIQANIRPETPCLVRCRGEYDADAFAVEAATFSNLPSAGRDYRRHLKYKPPVTVY